MAGYPPTERGDIVTAAVKGADRRAKGIVDGRSVVLVMFKSSKLKMGLLSPKDIPVWLIAAQVGSGSPGEIRTFYELDDAIFEFTRLKIKHNLVETDE